MLIRSQNKNVVFDMTGSNIEINSRNEIHGYGNTFLILGKYATEERAIEVLDEICKAYLDLNVSHHFSDYGYGMRCLGSLQTDLYTGRGEGHRDHQKSRRHARTSHPLQFP